MDKLFTQRGQPTAPIEFSLSVLNVQFSRLSLADSHVHIQIHPANLQKGRKEITRGLKRPYGSAFGCESAEYGGPPALRVVEHSIDTVSGSERRLPCKGCLHLQRGGSSSAGAASGPGSFNPPTKKSVLFHPLAQTLFFNQESAITSGEDKGVMTTRTKTERYARDGELSERELELRRRRANNIVRKAGDGTLRTCVSSLAHLERRKFLVTAGGEEDDVSMSTLTSTTPSPVCTHMAGDDDDDDDDHHHRHHRHQSIYALYSDTLSSVTSLIMEHQASLPNGSMARRTAILSLHQKTLAKLCGMLSARHMQVRNHESDEISDVLRDAEMDGDWGEVMMKRAAMFHSCAKMWEVERLEALVKSVTTTLEAIERGERDHEDMWRHWPSLARKGHRDRWRQLRRKWLTWPT